jgi:hypothetical protein
MSDVVFCSTLGCKVMLRFRDGASSSSLMADAPVSYFMVSEVMVIAGIFGQTLKMTG